MLKVGDTVKTPTNYMGVVLFIYNDGRVIIQIGAGFIYGCSLNQLTKISDSKQKKEQ